LFRAPFPRRRSRGLSVGVARGCVRIHTRTRIRNWIISQSPGRNNSRNKKLQRALEINFYRHPTRRHRILVPTRATTVNVTLRTTMTSSDAYIYIFIYIIFTDAVARFANAKRIIHRTLTARRSKAFKRRVWDTMYTHTHTRARARAHMKYLSGRLRWMRSTKHQKHNLINIQ
jgi:hypothetical protein